MIGLILAVGLGYWIATSMNNSSDEPTEARNILLRIATAGKELLLLIIQLVKSLFNSLNRK